MSMVTQQAEFLLDVCALVEFATSRGFVVTAKELQRTVDQQMIYVRDGRSTTMNSRHLDCQAIDLYFFKDGKLTYDTEEIGCYWESLNPKNSAGMFWKSFKDKPHFERRA